MKRCIWAVLLIASLVGWLPAQAQGPDYTLPGGFALPWACGQGHRVSWEPEGHWEYGKATGIAYDFLLEEGVPLYAPMNGQAYFLRDERPFETNLGYYIEIMDETGDWLVRLAHLRDEQQGERAVRAGELIGHSGASGVPSAHLHLELLMREGERWVRPDQAQLTRLFGLSPAELALGAYITNLGCPAQLTLSGEITPLQAEIALGEGVELLAPIYNEGLEPLRFDLLQIALYSTEGDALLAETQGDWSVDGKAQVEITVPVHPPSAGLWYVGRLTYRTEQGIMGTPARGQVEVTPSPLRHVGLGMSRGALSVGDLLRLYIWVENQGVEEMRLDALFIDGLRPDGVHWRAAYDEPLTLAPGEVQRVLVETDARLHQAGAWTLQRAGYRLEGREHLFAQLRRELVVNGPQLVVERIELFRSLEKAHVFVQVRNVGTALAEPEAIEIWGWKPGGESFAERLHPVAPLDVGQAALLQLDIPIGSDQGLWKLVEAGYCQQGAYYRMALPMQPAVNVSSLPILPAIEPPEPGAPHWEPISPGEGRPAPQ